MVVTRLSGGLGNQMFQYAAGSSLAQHLGVAHRLDLSWFHESVQQLPTTTPRSYELSIFRLTKAVAVYRPRLADQVRLRLMLTARLREYHEPHYHFDQGFFELPDNVLLDGYWQSERYFAAHAEMIRDEFTFVAPVSHGSARYLEQIQAGASVSLHVRRGDYVQFEGTRALYGDTDVRYYEAAIARFEHSVASARYFVFSDDLEWCKAHLPVPRTAVFVEGNEGARSFEDMRLMSACQHHIIANSSFSWWGAWLDRAPGKIVIAPKRWFLDPAKNTGDVVPRDWIRV